MRNSRCVLLLRPAVTAVPAMWAQDKDQAGQASRLELYGGYNYVRLNINASASVLQPSSQMFKANGGGQLVYNFNHWLGVLGDVIGYWATNGTKACAVGSVPVLFGSPLRFLAAPLRHTELAPSKALLRRPG